MGTANHLRVELVASPPCESFRPIILNAKDEYQTPFFAARYSRIAPITAFILAAAIVGFATNLSMHLLNLRMQAIGLSNF